MSALVEYSNDMVLVVAADGAVRYANPATERLLGYDTRAWAGRDRFDAFALIHPDDRAGVAAVFEEVVRGTRHAAPLAFRVRRADGTWVETEAVASSHLDDDAVGGVVVNLRDISERVRAQRAARLADERYRTLVSSLVYGVMLTDDAGRVVLCNEAVEELFGVPTQRLVGRPIADIATWGERHGVRVTGDDGQPVPLERHPMVAALANGTAVTGVVHRIEIPGRRPMWVRINARPIAGEGGGPGGVVASFADITEARQAEEELGAALSALHGERTFLRVLLDNLEEGIVACDAEGHLTLLNPAARRFHGLPEDLEVVGRPVSSAGLRTVEGTPMDAGGNPLLRALYGEVVRDAELVVENRQGERRVVVANAQALRGDDGTLLGAVVAMHDVTELKRNEQRLAELALHDPLTGVANRRLLDERLHWALERMRRGDGGVGVLLLDLDDFKAVNDRYGHDVGDDVLVAVARRLQATVRPQDTVARLGGDEFVVVCEVSGGHHEVERIAQRVERALTEPYRLEGHELTVTASVGRVHVEDPNTPIGGLLSRADDEMYRAKATRRAPGGAGR